MTALYRAIFLVLYWTYIYTIDFRNKKSNATNKQVKYEMYTEMFFFYLCENQRINRQLVLICSQCFLEPFCKNSTLPIQSITHPHNLCAIEICICFHWSKLAIPIYRYFFTFHNSTNLPPQSSNNHHLFSNDRSRGNPSQTQIANKIMNNKWFISE